MKNLLRTKRLVLRDFEMNDAKYIHRLHNDHEVMKYIPSKRNSKIPMEECEDFITNCCNYYMKKPGYGIWAVVLKDSNEFIGWTLLKNLDNTDEIEVGYRYFKEHWNKGYASEAARALLEYGFDKLNLDKIVAVAMPDNVASTRVMQKIGMDYIREDFYYNIDVVYYQIKKEKFIKAKNRHV